MHVVLNAADGQCLHAVVARDAAHVGPEALLQFRSDERGALFGAEDAVIQGGDV